MKGKGFDFKQFGINHGEKVALGVAGLLAVFVLLKTTWGTYQKQPAALEKAAKDAGTLIAGTQWPGSEAGKYPPDDSLGIQIGSMLTPIPGNTLMTKDGPGYKFSNEASWSLYLREKPMSVPSLLAVRNLIATADRMVIAKRSDSFVVADDPANPMGDTAKKPEKKGVFKVKRRGSAAGADGATPMGGAFGPGGVIPMGAAAAGSRGKVPSYAPRGPMGAVGPMGPMGEFGDGGMSGAGQQVQADGKRVVAVRGIFAIQNQLREFEKALHLPGGLSALEQVRIKDFILERSVSVDNGKTYGKWIPVDKKANVEYLKTKVADFDTDTVATGVTHFVITSPLPMRLLRYWGDEATHPELARYKLSEEGRKRQKLIDEAVQEQKRQLKKFKEDNEEGGFGGVQQNAAGDRSAIMSDAGATRGFEKYMLQGSMAAMMPDAGDGDGGRAMLNALKAEATAIGDLVLFRYFDFDVLPGRTYKYRVSLRLYNPLFGQPVEKLALEAQGSNKDEFRNTPVSNETTPVTVERDVDYFVDSITDWRSLRMDAPSVTLSVYEWMPDLGTVVKGKVRDIEPGQMIAGKDSKTKRLDPAKETLFINVPSEFSSDAVLLDLQAGHRKLDERHMRELGLSRHLKGKINITVPDQILVVDELGRLKQLDPLASQSRHSSVDSLYTTMMKEFKEWELDPADVKEDGVGGPMGMGDGLDGDIDTGAKGKKKKRKRGRKTYGSSPLRRGSGSSGGYPGGYPGGGYPGGGYPGGKMGGNNSGRYQPRGP